MPEKIEGKVVLRRGLAMAVACGAAVLGSLQPQEEAPKVEALSAAESEMFVPLPVEVTYVETTTSVPPTTTTTEAPTTTTTVPPTTTTAPPPPPAPVSGAPAEWMAAAGIPQENYDEVDFIMTKESEWFPGAVNDGGCIGLGQACPGGIRSTLEASCPDWANQPVCQLQVFQDYAYSRYGGWDNAAADWRQKGWW